MHVVQLLIFHFLLARFANLWVCGMYILLRKMHPQRTRKPHTYIDFKLSAFRMHKNQVKDIWIDIFQAPHQR